VEWWCVFPLYLHRDVSYKSMLQLTLQKVQCVYQQFCEYEEKIEFLEEELDRKYYTVSKPVACVGLDFMELIDDELVTIIMNDPRYVKNGDDSSLIPLILDTNIDAITFLECNNIFFSGLHNCLTK
jgi:hypothetical protein